MSIGKDFAKAVHGETEYWGTYPPQTPVKVGDHIEFTSDGNNNRLGSSLDWPGWAGAFRIEPVTAAAQAMYAAHANRTVGANAGAGVPEIPAAGNVSAKASIKLDFTRSSAFVLDYTGASINRYKSIEELRRWLLELARKGMWQPGHALVTEVVNATSASVVMSQEAASEVVLNASAAVKAATVNIADVSLGLTVSATRGATMVSLCQASTPLYRCVAIRKTIFGNFKAEMFGAEAPSDAEVESSFTDNPFADDV
jgi:hypothetical protein